MRQFRLTLWTMPTLPRISFALLMKPCALNANTLPTSGGLSLTKSLCIASLLMQDDSGLLKPSIFRNRLDDLQILRNARHDAKDMHI